MHIIILYLIVQNEVSNCVKEKKKKGITNLNENAKEFRTGWVFLKFLT